MAVEIERKFLVDPEQWQHFLSHSSAHLLSRTHYQQGYVASSPAKTVRVRIAGDRGYLTLKGATEGYTRAEFEYEIPLSDAEAMLNQLCDPPFIDKVRHRIQWADLVWEVDEFSGDNQGLIVAEVELQDAQQRVDLPPWVAAEVSHDYRYYNAYLAQHPFSAWTNESPA